MPIRHIPGTDLEYFLIVFDENGGERGEPDGTLLSDRVLKRVKDTTARVTDVFFMSHGWKGDVPAAIEQYNAWVTTMAGLPQDRDLARKRRPGFTPLTVGLHWPSLPWGDETIPAAGGAVLSVGNEFLAPIETQVDAYAARIAGSQKARAAIRSILEAARHNPDATALSSTVREAYATLFAESGLRSGDPSGRPGADQDGFDPEVIVADAHADAAQEGTSTGTPAVLGLAETFRNAVIVPLRQLSFWKMKDRARRFGESGGHELLV
jgi:hypothetical protein